MAKNSSKKMKDVCVADVLYKISKIYLTEGITELTVTEVGVDKTSGESWFICNDYESRNYIPKSSMNKTFISLYDCYIATSRTEALKVTEKFIKKNLDTVDSRIKDMKDRLDNLVRDREIVYRLYLEILTSPK